jgi:hypothetical protein
MLVLLVGVCDGFGGSTMLPGGRITSTHPEGEGHSQLHSWCCGCACVGTSVIDL